MHLRITKEHEERIKKIAIKINMERISIGKEVLKNTEIARLLLEFGINAEEEAQKETISTFEQVD